MPIQIHVHQDGAGVVHDCVGALTIQDFLQATKSLFATGEEVKKWRYGIIDLTSAESLEIGLRDMQSVVNLDLQIARLGVPGVLVAVVSARDLGFGLGRMWEVLAENTGWEIQVFRSRPEAVDWLRHRVLQKFDLRIDLSR